ncbi:hypothetical protein PV08_01051 [Exophiala spinifera]|uniref:Dienelactone hydrolase domain-containing protein n=1 Tax=Exophiala spinifera TaxID=91928 RepID=A0A0D1YYX5_9EURO|nr:uncharacterized protein PV08_01051 [Exophiala spinifera]KIW20476.1 hypothetical protein PV08_01051 [Exophiala spinifera]
MSKECCYKGFFWDKTPVGREDTLAGYPTYITGTNPDAALMIIHDMFGWTFLNTRVLADFYAKEADVTVYVPDFFDGEVIPPEVIRDRSRWAEYDIPAGVDRRHAKPVHRDQIFASARELRSKYRKCGAIGFCFGGWAVFALGADKNLIDAISTGHPTWLTKEEINEVSVPTQILAPEHDPVFTPELKAHANQVIPTRGVPYDYQLFPKVAHAFCTRGNPNDEEELKAMDRAKDAAVYWFKFWLHQP